MMENRPIIAVVGPTASGKTALSVEIAKYVGGEIISADSMQIYKEMSIASAAPTEEEKQGIKHHLFEFLSPLQRFTVADYVVKAKECINEVMKKGKTPVLVGGTGLYVDSLFKNIEFSNEDSEHIRKIREQLMAEFELIGGEKMLERLMEIDPKTANKLHANDKKRIIRALEIFKIHNKTKSELDEESLKNPSPYKVVYIGIKYDNRDILYERINKRVDLMLENGLLDEARKTYKQNLQTPYYSTAFQAIGHKEFYDYFNGNKELSQCVENLKMSTRRYAKRQLTWFNRNEDIFWVYPDKDEFVFEKVKAYIDTFIN